jgi:hypothetical protein
VSNASIIKVICLAIIGVPQIVASTQGIVVPPVVTLLLGVAGMVAGLVLSEMAPSFRQSED